MRLTLALLALTAAACATTAPARDPGPKVALTACGPSDRPRATLCGRHEVFEDREARAGRRIALNIVVLPALSATPAPDPVFFLTGGPAGAATDAVRDACSRPSSCARAAPSSNVSPI